MPARYTRRQQVLAFWSRVEITDACWLWKGAKDGNGYGHLKVWGKMTPAHVYAYVLLRGEYDRILVLDHTCRVHTGVRSGHLRPLPGRTNVVIGVGPAARALATECARGHPFNAVNTRWENGRRRCRLCRNLTARIRQARRKAA